MPYPVKIQPIDINAQKESPHKFEPKPLLFKSRFKRLFEKQFPNVSRNLEKPVGVTEQLAINVAEVFDPSSVCLGNMVQNFIEEDDDKTEVKCGRSRCSNCFNGNLVDSTDDEEDYKFSSIYACDILKSLVPCLSVAERNLLADTTKILETHKTSKSKDVICRKVVAEGLISLGYKASICKSVWEKCSSYPAGMYEYVDVIIGEERLIIDIDFRSVFEIARPTNAYKLIIQAVPNIFVGKTDRLESIVNIVSGAAKQSLKKKGMSLPPWRKAEFVQAKWLSPFTQIFPDLTSTNDAKSVRPIAKQHSCGELGLLFGEDDGCTLEKLDCDDSGFALLKSNGVDVKNAGPMVKEWEPPAIKPKSVVKGVKKVSGLASVIEV